MAALPGGPEAGGGIDTMEPPEADTTGNPRNPNAQPNPNANPANPNVNPADNPDVPAVPDLSEPMRVIFANLEGNVDTFAREAAHEKLAKEEQGNVFKKFAKNMWKTMTRPYQLSQAKKEARERILAEGDLRANQEGDSDAPWREATERRTLSEYAEHLFDKEKGEKFKKIGPAEAAADPDTAGVVYNDVMEHIRKSAKEPSKGGYADVDARADALKDLSAKWEAAGIPKEYRIEGAFMVENLDPMIDQVEAALNTRGALNALQTEAALDQILAGTELIFAEAKVGSSVEMEAQLAERLAEKLSGVKWVNEGKLAWIGSLLGNEVAVAGMISALTLLTKKGIGHFVIPGIGAAVFGAARERRALKDERALADRRRDNGTDVDPTTRRQRQIGETLNEAAEAGDLLNNISTFYETDGTLKITDRASLNAALGVAGEIKARMLLEAKGNRLINFNDTSDDSAESATMSEDRRIDLAIALAKLQADIDSFVATSPNVLNASETQEDILQTAVDVEVGLLNKEIGDKERLFNKLLRNRMLFRGLTVLATAETVHELFEHARELVVDVAEWVKSWGVFQGGNAPAMTPASFETPFNETEPSGTAGAESTDTFGNGATPSDQFGNGQTPEQSFGGGGTQPVQSFGGGQAPDQSFGGGSAPEQSFGGASSADTTGNGGQAPEQTFGGGQIPEQSFGGGQTPEQSFGGGENGEAPNIPGAHTDTLSDNSKVTLPNGYNAHAEGNHVTITGPNGQTINGELNPDGSLSQNMLDQLHANGATTFNHTETIPGPTTTTEHTVTAKEFNENHKDEMVKVGVAQFNDNGTKKIDLDELGLDNHAQPNGDIHVSIARMTAEGSFHGNSHTDWHQAVKDGHMMLYMSASKDSQTDSQTQAFEVTFNEKGEIVIPKGSPAAAFFDSKGNLTGGYERAAVIDRIDASGMRHVISLATVVGKNHTSFQDMVTTQGPSTTVHDTLILPPREPSAGPNLNHTDFTPGVTPPDEVPSLPIYARTPFGAGTRRTGTATTARPSGGRRRTARPTGVTGGGPGGLGRPPRGPRGSTTGPGGRGPVGPPSPGAPTNTGQPTNTNNPVTPPPPPPPRDAPTIDPLEGTSMPETNLFPYEARSVIDQIKADTRAVPRGFRINMTGANPLVQKMAIAVMHQVADKAALDTPATGRDLEKWRRNVAGLMVKAARDTLSNLNELPEGLRPLFERSMELLARVEPIVTT